MFKKYLSLNGRRSISLLSKLWSGGVQSNGNLEHQLKQLLLLRFPAAKTVEVNDVSGGCGAMFEISVETTEFKGLSTIKQHRLINETLKKEIKEMHGIRIHTAIPK